jgi:hypothetical protein
MLRFGVACLAGLVYGSVCSVVIWIFGAQIRPIEIANELPIGVVFGGEFGIVAFPICYYIFLREIPLWISLAVTIPATIVAGLLGMLRSSNTLLILDYNQVEWFLLLFGPSFLGLLLSSIALNRFATKVVERV